MSIHPTALQSSVDRNTRHPPETRTRQFFPFSYSSTLSTWTETQYSSTETDPTPTANALGVPYYGYRYFHPSLGRWVSRDPVDEYGGLNLYAFVFNNPVNLLDRNGEKWVILPIPWPPGAIPVPIPPIPWPKPGPVPKCPETAPSKSDPDWCLDDVFSPITHPGLICYRQVSEDTSGSQCCYDSDGNFKKSSPDTVNPACGRNSDGTCAFTSLNKICDHCYVDVLPEVLKKLKELVEKCGCDYLGL